MPSALISPTLASLCPQLDHRVEISREAKLCSNLFALATAASSSTAPGREGGRVSPNGRVSPSGRVSPNGRLSSNGRASPASLTGVSALSWLPGFDAVGSKPNGEASLPSKPKKHAVLCCDAVRDSVLVRAVGDRPTGLAVGTSSGPISAAEDSAGCPARSGPAFDASGKSGGKSLAPDAPVGSASVGHSGCSSAGGTSFKQASASFLRRRLGARRDCSEGKLSHEARGETEAAGLEDEEDENGRPRRRRTNGNTTRNRLSIGFDALNSRVDTLSASHEVMRRDVSEVLRLLSAALPAIAPAGSLSAASTDHALSA